MASAWARRQVSPSSRDSLPGSSFPHGVGIGLPPSLSFFPRLPGSSLPHGVGVGDSLARARSERAVLDRKVIRSSRTCQSRWASSPRPTSSLCLFNSCSHTQPHPKPFLNYPCNWYWCLYSCTKLREPSISCQEVNMTGLKRPGVEELTRKAWCTTPHE